MFVSLSLCLLASKSPGSISWPNVVESRVWSFLKESTGTTSTAGGATAHSILSTILVYDLFVVAGVVEHTDSKQRVYVGRTWDTRKRNQHSLDGSTELP